MRLILAALVIGMSLLSVSGQAQEESRYGNGDTAEDQSPPHLFPAPILIDIIEDQATAEARDRREQEADQREIEDLVAQQGMNLATQAMNDATQRMAEYAFWSTLLIGIGTALLFLTLGLTWQANKAARDAVEITRTVGQAQTRAYLAVSGGDFVIRKDGGIELNVEVRNFGQSPAKRGHVFAQLLIPRYRGGTIEADFDWSEPQDVEIFSISTAIPSIAAIDFKKPFPIDTVGILRETQGVLFAEVQVRWIDVFNEPNGPDEFRLQEELTGEPVFNDDLPRSRIGKMVARTKQPSDET